MAPRQSCSDLAGRTLVDCGACLRVDRYQADLIAPKPADMTQRGVAAAILQHDAVLHLVLQAQMSVAEQIHIDDLDIRPARADVVAVGEPGAYLLVATFIVYRRDFVVRFARSIGEDKKPPFPHQRRAQILTDEGTRRGD